LDFILHQGLYLKTNQITIIPLDSYSIYKGDPMKRLQIKSVLLLLTISFSSISEDLTTEKKQLIDELLTLTGATDLGQMFSEAYVQQMTYVLKQSRPDIEPRVFDILEEEVNEVINQEVGEGNVINELSYPIYHKYLTISDISELVQFYKTPLGKKTIDVMPSISQEAVLAGQQWGRSLGPIIQERLLTRFQQEGIDLQ
jgi:uncharacterized protein